MGVYTLAFIMFTLDLAKRSAWAQEAPVVAASTGRFAATEGTTATLERIGVASADKRPLTLRFERIAFALTVLAWIIHVAGTVLRGFAQGHVPWSNMFEFSLTASAIIVGVFIGVQFWQNLRFLGSYITGFALITLGVGTVNFYVDVKPLPPALQ